MIKSQEKKPQRMSISTITKITKTERLLRQCVEKFKQKSKNFTDFKEEVFSPKLKTSKTTDIKFFPPDCKIDLENKQKPEINIIASEEVGEGKKDLSKCFMIFLGGEGSFNEDFNSEKPKPQKILELFNQFIINTNEELRVEKEGGFIIS